MTEPKKVCAGRLAMRVEGDRWVAYFARLDSMKDAIFLGSIIMRAIVDNEKTKNDFTALMQATIADFVKATFNSETMFDDPQTAPEHERNF